MTDGYRVLLVRHGETTWNSEGRWQGHGGAGLNDRGLAQAGATAAFLARTEPDVSLVLHSDLQRVVETADPIVEVFDVPAKPVPAWREIDVGWWSGMTHAEIAERDPDNYRAVQRGDDVPRGGGETSERFSARIRAALDEIPEACAPGTVVVVTHGGPIRVAAATALGVAWSPAMPLTGAGNCSISVVEHHGGWKLRSYNASGHLTGI